MMIIWYGSLELGLLAHSRTSPDRCPSDAVSCVSFARRPAGSRGGSFFVGEFQGDNQDKPYQLGRSLSKPCKLNHRKKKTMMLMMQTSHAPFPVKKNAERNWISHLVGACPQDMESKKIGG